MTNYDEAPDSGDIGAGDQNDTDSQPPQSKQQSLKNFATKKGPKLARGKKKQTVTISNKIVKGGPTKSGGTKQ